MKKGLYCHQLLFNLLTKEQIDTTVQRQRVASGSSTCIVINGHCRKAVQRHLLLLACFFRAFAMVF